MQNHLISEEYLVKEFEKGFVRNIRRIMSDLGARRAADKDHQWSDRYWKRDNHLWVVSDHKDGDKKNRATFYEHHYDPEKSDRVYGETRTISDERVSVDGFSKSFDNTDSPIDTPETVRHLVRLSRNVTHTIQTHLESFIETDTKLSGDFPGGSIEQAIKTHFGFALDDTQSVSENTDEEIEEIKNLIVPAGKHIVVTYEKNKLITETPFSVDGYVDMGFKLDFEDWASSKHKQGHILFGTHKHSNVFRFNNLAHFERWLNGYDVEYPQMKKYKPSNRAIDAMHWIFNEKNRLIQAEGIKRREFENNVTIKTAEVR